MGIEQNLFYHATSELTQDALLAYMFSNYDNNITTINNFFTAIDIKDFTAEDIEKVDVVKQYSNINMENKKLSRRKIDLLVDVKMKSKKNNVMKILIVIEDKVKSTASENQLADYKEIINSDTFYKEHKKVFVYYKLDYPFSERLNSTDEYKVLHLLEIKKMFNESMISDPIVEQYYEYIKYLSNTFMNEKLIDWQPNNFKGFMYRYIMDNNYSVFNPLIKGANGTEKLHLILEHPTLSLDFEVILLSSNKHNWETRINSLEKIQDSELVLSKFKTLVEDKVGYIARKIKISPTTDKPMLTSAKREIHSIDEVKEFLDETIDFFKKLT